MLQLTREQRQQLLALLAPTDAFERIIAAVAKHTVKAGDRVIDGGANHGRHTRLLLEAAGPLGRVYAVEPIGGLMKQLNMEFAGNTAFVPVERVLYTVAEQEMNFQHVLNCDTYSVLKLCDSYDGFRPLTENIQVLSTTVDALAEKDGGNMSFVKLVLGGVDFLVLLGAEKTLNRHRPIVAFEDGRSFTAALYKYDERAVVDFFEKHRYCLFSAFGEILPDIYSWSEIHKHPWITFAIPEEKKDQALFIVEALSQCVINNVWKSSGEK